mmetsp:Transcript_53709/g.165236  ORF Transcript_53709/g.165236 Transcript_53709/m.165236 type:complete len:271 (-) Transcript_53709:1299-2111(-)
MSSRPGAIPNQQRASLRVRDGGWMGGVRKKGNEQTNNHPQTDSAHEHSGNCCAQQTRSGATLAARPTTRGGFSRRLMLGPRPAGYGMPVLMVVAARRLRRRRRSGAFHDAHVVEPRSLPHAPRCQGRHGADAQAAAGHPHGDAVTDGRRLPVRQPLGVDEAALPATGRELHQGTQRLPPRGLLLRWVRRLQLLLRRRQQIPFSGPRGFRGDRNRSERSVRRRLARRGAVGVLRRRRRRQRRRENDPRLGRRRRRSSARLMQLDRDVSRGR